MPRDPPTDRHQMQHGHGVVDVGQPVDAGQPVGGSAQQRLDAATCLPGLTPKDRYASRQRATGNLIQTVVDSMDRA